MSPWNRLSRSSPDVASAAGDTMMKAHAIGAQGLTDSIVGPTAVGVSIDVHLGSGRRTDVCRSASSPPLAGSICESRTESSRPLRAWAEIQRDDGRRTRTRHRVTALSPAMPPRAGDTRSPVRASSSMSEPAARSETESESKDIAQTSEPSVRPGDVYQFSLWNLLPSTSARKHEMRGRRRLNSLTQSLGVTMVLTVNCQRITDGDAYEVQ